MDKRKRLELIVDMFKQQETIKVSDIVKIFKLERTTVYRDFKELIQENKIKEIAK